MLKDFSFYVKCNDCHLQKVVVVAKDYYTAIEYAKAYYAQNNSIYADDCYNEWRITLS